MLIFQIIMTSLMCKLDSCLLEFNQQTNFEYP
jgi:hypothetical protein